MIIRKGMVSNALAQVRRPAPERGISKIRLSFLSILLVIIRKGMVSNALANPERAGFVRHPIDWKYSSAMDYYIEGGKGLLELVRLD